MANIIDFHADFKVRVQSSVTFRQVGIFVEATQEGVTRRYSSHQLIDYAILGAAFTPAEVIRAAVAKGMADVGAQIIEAASKFRG